jgi:hypothetical protein
VTGPIGSGKTLFMTRCLYREKLRRPDCTIATNYKLNGIDFKYLNASDLFDIKSQLQNTNIGIDEFHIFLDSRAFMKPSNQQLTHFILQTRHLGVNLYFTTQDISQVDIRLRKQLDFLAYCTQTVYEKYFRVKLIDYRDVLNVRTNDFIYDGTPYYDLYDTREIIDFTESNKKEDVKVIKENNEIKRLNAIIKEYEKNSKVKIEPETETITYKRKKRRVFNYENFKIEPGAGEAI